MSEWLPTRFTKPLSENYVSDGPKLRKLVSLAWKTPEDPDGIELDDWQADLIDRILERYPDDWPDKSKAGRLRYRQCLISVGRQNGKSVIGAILAMYGLLLHEKGPIVISLASNTEQARIIYQRVMYVIKNNPALNKRFKKTTETRGIELVGGAGKYEVKAAKGAALQGIPVSLCLFDELHIGKEEMWSAMVLGSAQRKDGLVVGITTAGDDNSLLLKDLYKKADLAIQGEMERFGAFIWEAPEGANIDDPDALKAANPSLACGRMSLDNAVNDVMMLPEHEARRYRHNRFVSSESAWMPMTLWRKCIGEPLEGRPVFTVDRTPSWEHATITASIKAGDKTYTEVVASIVKPSLDQLINICVELNRHGPITFAMDNYTLSDLHEELKRRGIPTRRLNLTDVTNACSTSYALIAQGRVVHTDEELLRRQMPFAIKKNVGDAWRISRQSSSHDIDAVMGMVMGLYVAETSKDMPAQVF
jgi:phage terminase large subunit-like protein